MHAPARAFAPARPALPILLVLSLWIACGPARALPVQIGGRTVHVPPPRSLVKVRGDQPMPAMTRPAAFILGPGIMAAQTLLYATQADLDSVDPTQPGRGHKMGRAAEFIVPPNMQHMDTGDAVFGDGHPINPEDLARHHYDKVLGWAHRESDSGIRGGTFLGVYRQEPWGVFFSFRTHGGGPMHEIAQVISCAYVLVNHRMVLLYMYSPVNDDAGTDLAWTQQTLSDWGEAIHRNHGDGGTHGTMLYRAVPWIVLVLLALMGYMLFFKKARPR